MKLTEVTLNNEPYIQPETVEGEESTEFTQKIRDDIWEVMRSVSSAKASTNDPMFDEVEELLDRARRILHNKV